jgi:N-acetylneuraminic acid mutarotase
MRCLLVLLFFVTASTSVKAQSWTVKSPVPDSARRGASGFSLHQFAYLCLGGEGNSIAHKHFNKLLKYDPAQDIWSTADSFPGRARREGIAFTTDSFAYVGMGWDNIRTYYDIYRYNPIQDQWDSVTAYPGNIGRACFYACSGNKAYIGGGYQLGSSSFQSDFWEYNIANNTWSQKASFPFGGRANGISFESGGLIYAGFGQYFSTSYNDLWAYDPSTNTWAQKASFPGSGRIAATYFSLNGKIIVGGGSNTSSSSTYNDYYEYDPLSDTWSSLGNFPIASRSGAAAFSLSGKAYVVTGNDGTSNLKTTLEFSPFTTSIKKHGTAFNSLHFYPNPSSELLFLERKENSEMSIRLLDITGKTLIHINTSKQRVSVDLRSLENGVYLLDLEQNLLRKSYKIIKN